MLSILPPFSNPAEQHRSLSHYPTKRVFSSVQEVRIWGTVLKTWAVGGE